VRKNQRSRVRSSLTPELLGAAAWRERRTLFGSEFYFSGPAAIAREAHAAAARLTSGEQVFRG
jgi:hypothetical protein